MEQFLEIIRKEKLSGSLLILVLLGTWQAYGWAESVYVRHGDFNELKTLITTHVGDMQIVNASQLLRDKELALQLAKATGAPDTKVERLGKEISDVQTYKQCLVREEPNCKHLKPPE